MLKRHALLCVASVAATVVALAAGTGLARAGSFTTVSQLGCAFDGGSTSVPAGDIALHLGGYADGTLGLMRVVLAAQTTTLRVGGATYDLSQQWSAPLFDSADGFWSTWQSDFDIGTLATGQSITMSYDIEFSHPVAVLFLPVGSSGDNGPFVINGEGPFTCTITAT